MGYLLLAFAIAAVVTYLAIPVIINIATEKKLYDIPDARKVHKNPIPSLGGVAIFAGFIIAILLVWKSTFGNADSYKDIQFIAAACLVVFFLGLKDDIIIISPLKKFIGQLFAAWIIVYKCSIQINNFHGVFGIYEVPNAVSLGITYLAIVLITNSFNLIDGIDGLSGNLTFIASISFAIYFYSFGLPYINYGIIAAAMAGAVASFLIFNHHPAKIFMGDTGSLLIGLIQSVLLIKFINLLSTVEYTAKPIFTLYRNPIIALSFLSVPLFDTIRVFSLRILKGRSPFSPDRNHIHHILLDKGLTHNRIALVLSFTSVFFIASTYLLSMYLQITAVLIILLVIASGLFMVAFWFPQKKQEKASRKKPDATNSKIVNMARDAVL